VHDDQRPAGVVERGDQIEGRVLLAGDTPADL
jgi:hypothetical protein